MVEEFSVKSHHHHAIWRNIFFDNCQFDRSKKNFLSNHIIMRFDGIFVLTIWSIKEELYVKSNHQANRWIFFRQFGFNKEVNEKLGNPKFKHFSYRIKSFGWWVINFRRVITHLRNHDSAIWTLSLRATSYHFETMFFTTQ